jgi:hypothetical protein
LGIYRSENHESSNMLYSNLIVWQSEHQSDGSREESEEPTSYHDEVLEYDEDHGSENYK